MGYVDDEWHSEARVARAKKRSSYNARRPALGEERRVFCLASPGFSL
jgi:hypothetical protein